ncbi:MAG: sigma-70 family RNA polymerase sigma factor [Acidimicrobiia bacterium]
MNETGVDDPELAARAAHGDRAAFSELYDRYSDRIHSYCFGLLRNREEAADATQETFVRVIDRLHQLRDPAAFRPWLYAIARNESLQRLRRGRRIDLSEEDRDVEDEGPGPDARAEQAEAVGLVWTAMHGLAPRDREVLELHLRHGMVGRELADAVGVNLGHAYVLLNRAKARVERSIGSLLLARHGSRRCDELAALLSRWDGRYTPRIRSLVSRHVEGCEVCEESRAGLVAPLALVAALPLSPAPSLVRERVMARFDEAHAVPAGGEQSWAEATGATGREAVASTRRAGILAVAAGTTAVVVAAGVAWLAPAPAGDQAAPMPVPIPSAQGTSPSSPSSSSSTGASGLPVAEVPVVVALGEAGPVDGQPAGGQPADGQPVVEVGAPPPSADAPPAPESPVIVAPSPGRLEADRTVVDFGGTGTVRGLHLRNVGGDGIAWEATSTSWLGLGPASGVLAPGESVEISLTLDRTGLPEGPFDLPFGLTGPDGSTGEVRVRGSVSRAPTIEDLAHRVVRDLPGPPGAATCEATVHSVAGRVVDESAVELTSSLDGAAPTPVALGAGRTFSLASEVPAGGPGLLVLTAVDAFGATTAVTVPLGPSCSSL